MFDQLFETFDTIIFFDTETTGFSPSSSRMTELAALTFKKDDPWDPEEYDNFIRLPSGMHIPDKVRELTGITERLLMQEGVSEKHVMEDFCGMLGKQTLLCAYNAHFDQAFICDALERLFPSENKLKGCHFLDALTIFKDRSSAPHKLKDAISHYCLDGAVQNTHRAIDDAKALCAVVQAMEEEENNLFSYVDVFTARGIPKKNRAPGVKYYKEAACPSGGLPEHLKNCRFSIFQLNEESELWSNKAFASIKELNAFHLYPDGSEYQCVFMNFYDKPFSNVCELLDDVYDYYCACSQKSLPLPRAIAPSDVIAVYTPYDMSAWYVDDIGFCRLPNFFFDMHKESSMILDEPEH